MKTNIYNSIDDIGIDTIDQFTGSELDFSYGILRAIEKSLWGDLRVDYLTVELNGKILSFTPAYTGTNVNINALLPQTLQKGYLKLTRFFPKMKTKFCIAGSLISDKGWIPMIPDHDNKKIIDIMISHIDAFSVSNNVKVSLIKDIHYSFPKGYLSIIERQGYKKLYSLPTVVVDTNFNEFSDYTKSLKKNARKHSRKVLKAANDKFTFEIINNYQDYVDDIYPLFRATYLKAKYQFDEGTPQFIHECSKSKSPKTELIVCKRKNKIVGALINFYNNDEQMNKRIGVDYNQEDSPLIYASLMYEGIRSAINKNINLVYLGQSTYVPKIRLGGKFDNVFFYVKSYDPLLKISMPLQYKWSKNFESEHVKSMALEGASI